MAKLHEMLAVENDLRTQADSTRSELAKTFVGKGHHFTKKLVTYKPNKVDEPDKVESQLALQTTVHKELDWIGEKIAKVIDSGHQIDIANMSASANVILEDETLFFETIPATSLLRMEHRLTEVRDLIHAIPTLDPSKNFLPDPNEGDGIFKARDSERIITEKKVEWVTMVPATDRHPAQTKDWIADRPIGVQITQEWSSCITVAEKADMLDRVEELIRAVKKARARANDQEFDVKRNKIGEKILSYIFNGLK